MLCTTLLKSYFLNHLLFSKTECRGIKIFLFVWFGAVYKVGSPVKINLAGSDFVFVPFTLIDRCLETG